MGYVLRLGRTSIDDQDSNAIIPATPSGPWGPHDPSAPVPSVAEGRHDGWTGALMAQFCEVLAETGIVVDACLAVGKSANTAYATRRRDPLFAAMWEAALGIARNRLADALLARSIEGSVEYYYRDGELVGEKRHIDNRLGLAVLRRLDRLAETGSPLPYQPFSVRPEPGRGTALPAPPPTLDWDQMIAALRTGEPGAMATALAALKACPEPSRRVHETHETHDPPNPPAPNGNAAENAAENAEGGDDEIDEGADRVWQSHADWWTDFPPPAGFNGVEHGSWGSSGYKRVCTDEEIVLLDAAATLDNAEERAAQEAERTAYFADIAEELTEQEQKTDIPDPFVV